MKFLCHAVLPVLGFLLCSPLSSLAQLKTNKTATQAFALKFEPKHPLVYAIEGRLGLTMTMHMGAKTTTTKTVVDTRYKVRLTAAGSAHNGVTLVHYEPCSVEQDVMASGPAGQTKVQVRGLSVKATQNGIVTIDTDNNIGASQAKTYKGEAISLLLSGQIEFDSRGNAATLHGDLPFVDFWTNTLKTQVGFFGILFPEGRLAGGDSWTETVPMKSMGEIKLEGSGLTYTNTYTRQSDVEVEGKTLAAFGVSGPMRCKDLTGLMEQMGQSTRLNISDFNRHYSGVVHFDYSRGVIADSELNNSVEAEFTALVQGQTMSMDIDTTSEEKVTLQTEP